MMHESRFAPREVHFVPDAAGWARLLASVDSRDADAFSRFLTRDAAFIFGNAPALVGTAAIVDGVAGFFRAIAACQHRLSRIWQGSGAVGCEGTVTYTRLNGSVLVVPFANVFEVEGDLIRSYRVYIDNSALFVNTTDSSL